MTSPQAHVPAADRRLISRVRLRNFRNIAACDVKLSQLSFLVGVNGTGKSNFLDALALVAESLRSSLGDAMHRRGGVQEVVRRAVDRQRSFGIRLDYSVGDFRGHYAVSIGSHQDGGAEIEREECRMAGPEGVEVYEVEAGTVTRCTLPYPPAASRHSLYLVRLAGVPGFELVHKSLAEMASYRLNPDAIRELQGSEPGVLRPDGRNLADVLAAIESRSPRTKARVDDYLKAIVPGLVSVDRQVLGPKHTLVFKQTVREGVRHKRFLASQMSDGTLRATGVLAALLQCAGDGSNRRRLVCIEEPEIALHPETIGVLMDILVEAANSTQVIVTTHSAELLDNKEVPVDSIVAVTAEHGVGRFGPVDEVGRAVIEKGSFTAGELMRMVQLLPDPTSSCIEPSEVVLFDASNSP